MFVHQYKLHLFTVCDKRHSNEKTPRLLFLLHCGNPIFSFINVIGYDVANIISFQVGNFLFMNLLPFSTIALLNFFIFKILKRYQLSYAPLHFRSLHFTFHLDYLFLTPKHSFEWNYINFKVTLHFSNYHIDITNSI